MAQLAEAAQAATNQSMEVAFVDQDYTGDQPLEAATRQGIRREVVKNCKYGRRVFAESWSYAPAYT